ncbi:hypothetical protein V2A60_004979 [Cordyceps javanica]
MDPRRPSLDLATELTCSICTELLYQPLTLLDCLHTFCGACLKEWFGFQKEKLDRAPSPPAPDAVLFTCPSCRASVRDTKHNATVVTLLDMYIAAKPNKARTEDDKEEMNRKYQPGDQIIPHVTTRERTAEERRAEEDDRRLIDEVREMSLREAETGMPAIPPRRRRGSRATEERISSRRARDDGRPRRSTNQLGLLGDGHRHQRSESQQRQVGHQSSLRSLISSADLSERDIEREIEDFARQIQEEGLLDGLDLDNIDLTRDDELSRRITEAYRRRQRDRATSQPSRRDSPTSRNEAHASTRNGDTRLDPRPRPLEVTSSSRSREGSSSRPATGGSSTEERDRRPPTSREVRESQTRTRRRTASGSRAATIPIVSTEPPVRPAARSQTDLTLPSERVAASSLRPNTCTSSLVENAAPGDYDICCPCYADLVNKDQISAENGHSGWRRCLKGHRMAVIGFAPGEVGHWRYIERDLVGGRKLRIEPLGEEGQTVPPSQKWSWKQDEQKLERLVTQEVLATAPASHDSVTYTTQFPPDGGVGLRVYAKWAWFPKEDADDELMFPRGAEIREAEDVNGEWFFGVYMGAKGLFPSGYVRVDGETSQG